MSHYRNLGGGKRDANEPQIIKRFAAHGWHAEQISGNRLWDLLVFHKGNKVRPYPAGSIMSCVDVKEPKGTVTPAQEGKWRDLAEKGIPVYVVRSEVEADALVRGELKPWGVAEAKPMQRVDIRTRLGPTVRKAAAHYFPPPDAKRMHATALRAAAQSIAQAKDGPVLREVPRGSRTNRMATKAVVPSAEDAAVARAMLAAQEAEATFAPAPISLSCGNCGSCMECMRPVP